jgi:hypothetical protein
LPTFGGGGGGGKNSQFLCLKVFSREEHALHGHLVLPPSLVAMQQSPGKMLLS